MRVRLTVPGVDGKAEYGPADQEDDPVWRAESRAMRVVVLPVAELLKLPSCP